MAAIGHPLWTMYAVALLVQGVPSATSIIVQMQERIAYPSSPTQKHNASLTSAYEQAAVHQLEFRAATAPSFTPFLRGRPAVCGTFACVARKADGTAVAWGNQHAGGDASSADLTNVVDVMCGGYVCSARKADHTGVVWGPGQYGGDGPRGGVALTNVADISCGYGACVAVFFDGTAASWGDGNHGANSGSVDLTNVAAAMCGWTMCVARKHDGTVVAWGMTSTGSGVAVNTAGLDLTNVADVMCAQACVARKHDGTVITWGLYAAQAATKDLTNVADVTCGFRACIAIKHDGTAITWGEHWYGGNSAGVDLTNVADAMCGYSACAARKHDSTAVVWGSSTEGGNAAGADLTNVAGVACGGHACLAYKHDGTALTWGAGGYGGNSAGVDLTNVAGANCGIYACVAYKHDGTAVSWGHSAYGGDASSVDLTNLAVVGGPTPTQSPTPAPTATPPPAGGAACIEATYNVPEASRSYSSVYGNDAVGTGHARSVLDSAQAWSTQSSAVGQWMEIDLGILSTVLGLVTQGRSGVSQWVTTYTVALSVDGQSWENLDTIFTGNIDFETKVVGRFSTQREARYVRIKPQTWSSWMSMRSGVLACTTLQPPTPATPPPASGAGAGASAVGDPHLQNVHGERFDLMKAGKHVLVNIPRGVAAGGALLRVQADARRLGGHCADMYFQELNVTGSWAEAKQVGGYHYSVSQREAKHPEWVAFGKVELKVVHGRTDSGLLYLNLYVKHLGRAGFAVGGLLGEDDHGDVSIAPDACAQRLALVAGTHSAGGPEVASVAVANFD